MSRPLAAAAVMIALCTLCNVEWWATAIAAAMAAGWSIGREAWPR